MKRVVTAWASAILCLIGTEAILLADYRDSYRRGIQAYNRRNWTEAARQFREAIAEQPVDTGERINISGMDFRRYMPQFYLGVALKNVNDCAGALVAWQRTDTRVVEQARELGNLNTSRQACQALVAKAGAPSSTPAKPNPPATTAPSVATAPPVPSATTPTTDGEAMTAALERARTALATATQEDAAIRSLEADIRGARAGVWQERELEPAYEAARRTLTTARSRFEAAETGSDARAINDAGTLANNAATQLGAVRQHALARRDELRRELAAAAATRPSAPSTPATAPATAPSNSGAAGNPMPAPVRATEGPPPQLLVAAASLYFSGDYAGARARLSDARFPPGLASTQAALFRAASAYSLYLVGGERTASLLEDATAQVRLCRESDPALRPDPRVFTPRFVEFYRSTR